MPKLIANMIGKNETDRYLYQVLQHLSTYVDEIVFTDDASDDGTAEMAEKFGAHVQRLDSSLFEVHEGNLRGSALRWLSEHAEEGDWILAIDCDEVLYKMHPSVDFDAIIEQDRYDVINIRFYHMWNETHYRTDGGWAPHNSSRMFRFYPGGFIDDRQLACGSEPTYVKEMVRRRNYMANTGLIMQHLGYVRDEDKKAKYDRYMKIDAGSFHARKHIESIIQKPQLAPWMGYSLYGNQ